MCLFCTCFITPEKSSRKCAIIYSHFRSQAVISHANRKFVSSGGKPVGGEAAGAGAGEMVGPQRPQFVLFGSSIVQISYANGGWGAILSDVYARKVISRSLLLRSECIVLS